MAIAGALKCRHDDPVVKTILECLRTFRHETPLGQFSNYLKSARLANSILADMMLFYDHTPISCYSRTEWKTFTDHHSKEIASGIQPEIAYEVLLNIHFTNINEFTTALEPRASRKQGPRE